MVLRYRWQKLAVYARKKLGRGVRGNDEGYARARKRGRPDGFKFCIVDYRCSYSTYVIAQDLEYLHGKSARASNGVNTLSVNTHLVGRLAAGTTVTHTIDTFAHYEGVLMIVNGIAQAQI